MLFKCFLRVIIYLKIIKSNQGKIIISFLKYFAVISLLFIILSSCSKEESEKGKNLNEKLNFNSSEYLQVFRGTIISIDSSLIKLDTLIQYYDTLQSFYISRNFEPLIIKSFDDADIVYSILTVFEKATEHGLNPEQYHFSSISEEFTKSIDSLPNNFRYSQLANAEILLADGLLKYSNHLRYGAVNPKEIFSDSYYLPLADSSKGDLFEPLMHENILEYLKNIQPKSRRYIDLQSALKYNSKFKDIDWITLPVPAKKIEPGNNDSLVAKIAQKLILLEYLDTSKTKISDFTYYDSVLVDLVKAFQRNNGLIDDGIIGKSTIERFNISPKQYLDIIRLNLERFRWNAYSDTGKYVLVNIPDFMLYIFDNGKKVFNTKVCTGSKRSVHFQERIKFYKKTKRWRDKPDDWETPTMYGEISYIVLNPTWNVPPSIMREEIAYKLKKDSTYLRDKNFKVYKDGVEIDPMEVQLNDLHSEKIPYRIIQDPGAGNALGKLKFMFNNPFGIYLHDTPNRPPFNLSNRAVSHGCVRVEKPLQLAEFLLRNHPKWNIDYLKIEIGQKVDDKAVVSEYYKKRSSLRKNASLGETTDVTLAQKTSLYIDYYTAWINDNGVLQLRADVYDRDKVLLEFMNSKRLISSFE